jgi:2-methylisocitrate lyase-like PEP mutase family enzyme
MTSSNDISARFLALHHGDSPLLIPNPWDAGSARILAWLGYQALATTSGGFAATLGRLDGSVSAAEALAHAATIVAATDLPVSADLENGFGTDPGTVAETVEHAVQIGLAGCSIEDFSGDQGAPIYAPDLAAERIVAAADAAHSGPRRLVLTARAENYLHGHPGIGDTITRLQSFQEAGADVLYAPGVTAPADIAAILSAVDRPVNVLLMPATPSVAELADLGVHRISVGSTFATVALGALVEAARELKEQGTSGFFARAATGRDAVRGAFTG